VFVFVLFLSSVIQSYILVISYSSRCMGCHCGTN